MSRAAPTRSPRRCARKATGQPEAVAWFKRLGLVGTTIEDAVFAELVHAFGGLDMEPFFRNLRAIGEHDAERRARDDRPCRRW